MDLESRVDYLERQNRWMKAAILAIALIAVAMGQFRNTKDFAAFKNDIVKAIEGFQASLNEGIKSREFVLINEKGSARGVWSVVEGKSLFTLLDTDGKPLLGMGVSEESRGLEILNAEGRRLVSFGADEHAGSLLIRSPEADSRATAFLRVGVTGPELTMTNNEGIKQPLTPW